MQFELPIDVQITDNESATKREFLKHIKLNDRTLVVSGVSSSRRVAEALSNYTGDFFLNLFETLQVAIFGFLSDFGGQNTYLSHKQSEFQYNQTLYN